MDRQNIADLAQKFYSFVAAEIADELRPDARDSWLDGFSEATIRELNALPPTYCFGTWYPIGEPRAITNYANGVLVWVPAGQTGQAKYIGKAIWDKQFSRWLGPGRYYIDPPTHWMPYPKGP